MAYNMEQTFRWYGPKDPVSLEFVRQTGATGVVSSLHHIPYGEVWSVEEIEKYKKVIEDAGLVWSVVESLPVHEDIKTGSGRCEEYIANYKESLRNLGKCGVKVITYNFMPVLDWIRTDLHYRLPDGSEALYFNQAQFAAFEIFILKRAGAEKDYTPEKVAEAKAFYESLTPEELQKFTTGLIDNFPGFKGVTLEDVRAMLKKYEHLTRADLEANLKHFLFGSLPGRGGSGLHHGDPPGRPAVFDPRPAPDFQRHQRREKSAQDGRQPRERRLLLRGQLQRPPRQRHRRDVQGVRRPGRFRTPAQHAA